MTLPPRCLGVSEMSPRPPPGFLSNCLSGTAAAWALLALMSALPGSHQQLASTLSNCPGSQGKGLARGVLQAASGPHGPEEDDTQLCQEPKVYLPENGDGGAAGEVMGD